MQRLVPVLGCVLALAGCASSSSSQPVAAATATAGSAAPSAPALPSCRPVPAARYTWPAPVPADLPRLPGATLGAVKQSAEGLTIVRFRTDSSLREGVLFIVRRLPAAGYVLGRGDAEATEADAPFSKGDLRGVLRGIRRDACSTEWLLAVTRTTGGGTGNPLLPMRQGASPSPLPFGNG